MSENKLLAAVLSIAAHLELFLEGPPRGKLSRNRRGVFDLLVSLGKVNYSIYAFYRAINEGENGGIRSRRLFKACTELLQKLGFVYDKELGTYVDPSSVISSPLMGKLIVSYAKYSIDDHLSYLYRGKAHGFIAQTYIEQFPRYCELIKHTPLAFDFTIVLPDPGEWFANNRNNHPHPCSQVDIPARIREQTQMFETVWEQKGRPDNLRLLYYKEVFSICLYAVDGTFRYAPFYRHDFAAYSHFISVGKGEPLSGDLSKEIEHLCQHSKVIIGAPFPPRD